MRILHVINGLGGGGAEKLVNDLVPMMNKEGHICEVIILSAKEEKYLMSLRNNDVTVFVSPYGNRMNVMNLLYIQSIVVNRAYDIIHAHLFPTIYWVSLLSRLILWNKPKIVMTEHNTDNRRRHIGFMRFIEKRIYKQYDSIISISEQTKKNLLNWLKPGKKQIVKYEVIENGINIEKFRNGIPYEKHKIFPLFPCDGILIGMVGSFTKQKNHAVLLEALKKVPNNVKVIFAGEGPLEDSIKRMVRDYGLCDRVSFLGFRSDIERLFHTIDIVVIPSLWEGFGLVAVEAMACGKPIIASNVPGLHEIVGENGLHFNPADSDDLACKISLLIDTEKRFQYSALAAQRASEFKIECMLKRYMNVYHKLLIKEIG